MNDALVETTRLSGLEYHNLIRHRIEHEDTLIVQRLAWLVGSQSFLFTAYAIVLNGVAGTPAPATTHFAHQQLIVYHLVPVVAILTCGLIYLSILAAVRAMAVLRHSYHSRFGISDTDLPSIQTTGTTAVFGLAAPVVLPLVFIGIWLFLWIRG